MGKINKKEPVVTIELTRPELMIVVGSIYNVLNMNAAPKEFIHKFEKLVKKLEKRL